MKSFNANPRRPENPGFGALVVSLDFELHWGVRDHCPPDGPYRRNLLGAREAIPRILDLFEEFGIAATWATVGFLFASSRRERERFLPAVRARYADAALDPYSEPTDAGEQEDPLHFAASLIELIRRRDRQEIASHTFSHFYCLEPGSTREAFEADLRSAVAIARLHGLGLRSMVFPRNQFNPDFADLLLKFGILSYRGNARSWMYRARPRNRETLMVRGPRLLDQYVNLSGEKLLRWDEILEPHGLCNVRSSAFLRPFTPAGKSFASLRLRRIANSIRAAATRKEIFHLWWHPHNFGAHADENLQFLRSALEEFARCRECYGMRSLSMAEVAEQVRDAHGILETDKCSVDEDSALEHVL